MQHQLTYTKKQWLIRWIIYHVAFVALITLEIWYYASIYTALHYDNQLIEITGYIDVSLIPASYLAMWILNELNDRKRAVALGLSKSKVTKPRAISLAKIFGGFTVLTILYLMISFGATKDPLSCVMFVSMPLIISCGLSAAHTIYTVYIFGVVDSIESYAFELWEELYKISAIIFLMLPIFGLIGLWIF